MKGALEYLAKKKLMPIFEVVVPSRTREGLKHSVTLWSDGVWRCSCEAGTFKKPCHHKKIGKKIHEKVGHKFRKAIVVSKSEGRLRSNNDRRNLELSRDVN